MPFEEVNGLKVYYEVHGEGEETLVELVSELRRYTAVQER